jgi:biotin operon repressor
MKRSKSHFALLKNSSRLQLIKKLLSRGNWVTSAEIYAVTGSMAVHTDIHELRENGVNVSPAKYTGLSATGRKKYAYRIIRGPIHA